MTMEPDAGRRRKNLVIACLRLALVNNSITRGTKPQINTALEDQHEFPNTNKQDTRPPRPCNGHACSAIRQLSQTKGVIVTKQFASRTTVVADHPTTFLDPFRATGTSSKGRVYASRDPISKAAAMGEPANANEFQNAHLNRDPTARGMHNETVQSPHEDHRSDSLSISPRTSTGTTLVSVEPSPAGAQSTHESRSSSNVNSSFASTTSPCVQIPSSLVRAAGLGRVDSCGHNDDTNPCEPGKGEGSTGGISPVPLPELHPLVVHTSRDSTGTGASHPNEIEVDSPDVLIRDFPSLSLTDAGDTERQASLNFWLSRVAKHQVLQSTPKEHQKLRRTTIYSSSPPSRASTDPGHLKLPITPSPKGYPQFRARIGRIVHKGDFKVTAEMDEVEPLAEIGEFVVKPTRVGKSRQLKFTDIGGVEVDQGVIDIRSKERLYKGMYKLITNEDLDEKAGQASNEADPDELEKKRFATCVAKLSKLYGRADSTSRTDMNEKLENMLKGFEHLDEVDDDDEETALMPARQVGDGVSILRGKHGDENYFGQTALTPAFL